MRFFFILADICPFCWATDTPVLDLWWRFLSLKACVHPLACMLHCLCKTESSDSSLVQHLLISWWPAWQSRRSHPRISEQALVGLWVRLSCQWWPTQLFVCLHMLIFARPLRHLDHWWFTSRPPPIYVSAVASNSNSRKKLELELKCTWCTPHLFAQIRFVFTFTWERIVLTSLLMRRL